MAMGVALLLILSKIPESLSKKGERFVMEARLEEQQTTINQQQEFIASQQLKLDSQNRVIRRLETLLAILAKETDSPISKRYLEQIEKDMGLTTKEPEGLKERLYMLVSDNKIDEAFLLSINEFPNETDLVLLSSRWTRAMQAKRKGSGGKHLTEEMNMVIDSLLSIINEQINCQDGNTEATKN